MLVPNLPFENKTCGWELHLHATWVMNTALHLLITVVSAELRHHFGWQIRRSKLYFVLAALTLVAFLYCAVYLIVQHNARLVDIENYLQTQGTHTFLYFLGAALGCALFDTSSAQQAEEVGITPIALKISGLFSKDWLGDLSFLLATVMLVCLQELLRVTSLPLSMMDFLQVCFVMTTYILVMAFGLVLFALGKPRLLLGLANRPHLRICGYAPNAVFLMSKLCIIKNLHVYEGIKFGPYTLTTSMITEVALISEALLCTSVFYKFMEPLLQFFDFKQKRIWL